MADNLLLKFRRKDTAYGVTRDTLRALADELGLTETMVVHLAAARLAGEVLPAYAADEGPLPADYFALLRADAKPRLAKGRVLRERTLT